MFEIKTTEEIVNDLLINIVTEVGEVNDTNVGSVLRILVEAFGLELSEIYTQMQDIYNGTRIDTSTGDDLDNLGLLVGVERKEGTKAQGYVSFIRKTSATSDFIIPKSTIISTQPNTGEEQLRYLVANDTTFKSSITNETHKFINGIYDYVLDERFMESIQSIDGISGGGAYIFQEGTDFQITKDFSGVIVEPDSVDTLDDCDSIAGWTESSGATPISLDEVDFKQGTGSLNLGKSGTISETIYYEKTLGSIKDIEGKKGLLWLKINSSTLSKINYIKFSFGSGGDINNSYSLKINQNALISGWNLYNINFLSSLIEQLGFPDLTAINYLRITIVTNNSIDTITEGNIKMDFWFGANSEIYSGDIISFLETGTLPDNDTDFEVDYKPLSREVLCESEEIGVKYNVTKFRINYKVSFISNVDSVNNQAELTGGTDKEPDDDLRERIKNASELKSKATVESLRQAVLGISGVSSVTVEDMPLNTATDEAHIHTSFATTPTFKLDYEVALDDDYFRLTGTRDSLPVTFEKNVDYILEDSEINWVDDLKDPDDGTIVLARYNYRWLGHVNIFVTGVSSPISSVIAQNIDDVILDTKSAGVDVQWTEPTIVYVDVNCSVLIFSGYIWEEVKSDIETKLLSYFNQKQAGEDVFIAELIDNIMDVEGVENVKINTPVEDVSILFGEVAKAGTIEILEIID